MQDISDFLLGVNGMMPHGTCFLWNPALLWLFVVANAIIALAYFSIPLAFGVFVHQRKDVNFKWMLILFGCFIFACGITHVLAIVTIWQPVYGLASVAEAITALVSVVTAIMLWPLIPNALRIPSPSSLLIANKQLEEEILFHKATKAQLSQLNAELDQVVEARTKALQDSDFRWKFAIEGSGDGLWDWNMANDTVFFSTSWKAMLGFADHEMGNGPEEWEQRIHPEDRAEALATMQGYIDGKTPVYASEHRLLCKDGGYKWILDRAMIVGRDGDGKALRMIGIHTDITGLKQAEQKNHLLGDIIEQSLNEVYINDRDTLHFEYVNNSVINNLGYSLEELKNKAPPDIKPTFDLASYRAFIRPLLTGEQQQLRFESVHRRKDGSRYPVDISLQMHHGDSADYLVAIAMDISQRKAIERSLAEERNLLSNLINHIPDYIFYKNTDGEYKLCNQMVANYFNRSALDIIGHDDFAFLSPEMAEAFRRYDAKVLAEQCTIVKEETIGLPDGRPLTVEMLKTPFRDNDGKLLGLIGIGRDITVRKANEHRISRLSNFYASFSKINHAIIQIDNEQELFVTVCAITANIATVNLAWIGLPDADTREIWPVAVAGELHGCLADLKFPLNPDIPEGHGPTAQAYLENKIVVANGFQGAPTTGHWQPHCVWVASCAVPVLKNRQPYAVLTVYSDEKDFFDGEVQDLLGELSMDIAFALDLYSREAARCQAEKQLQLTAKVFSQGREAIMISDRDNTIMTVNKAFTAITGYTEQEVVGKNPKLLASGRQDRDFYRALWDTLLKNNFWCGELWNRHKDGTIYPEWLAISVVRDEAGEVANYIGTFTDISQNKRSEQQIERLSHFDPLTNLPNRLLLKSRVDYQVIVAARHKQGLALLFVDLDHFKNINDSLGHTVGDQLLIEAGQRLLACVREEDTVARLGGDEFVILLADCNSNGAALVSNNIITAISAPIAILGHQLHITASVGISLYPHNGNTFEELSKNADTALNQAKKQGRNQYQFFTAPMQEQSVRRMAIENGLRQAIANHELMVYFQAQADTQTLQINGAEALLRWRHPLLGMVTPSEFIPVAEECGLIVPIGDWVLDQAVTVAKQCHDEGFPLTIAVNLSLAQFRANALVDTVRQTLAHHRLPPECLELELTESIAMHNTEMAIDITHQLTELGVKLSIDDFGTGYSSLSYLQRFSLHKLKIDQSFTLNMVGNRESENIVDAIISLAKSLGLKTIAEGVETDRQLAMYQQKQCDEIQGYYFSQPIPADEFLALVRDNKT